MSITAVIMSGGAGTRIWPLSTEETPKQFLSLLGDKTMLQQTVSRFQNILFRPEVIFLANSAQTHLIHEQMGDQSHVIIAEPCRRNTAAAAAAAAFHVRKHLPDNDLILLAPADHVIIHSDAFLKAIKMAQATANDGYIVTFGIRPDKPETGYGYIKRATKLSEGIFRVETFKEKPDLETAKAYCESGLFDWNAGIFLFSARLFLDELKKFHPEIFGAVESAYAQASHSEDVITLDEEAFKTATSISIDYAVMEKTDRAAIVPCDIGWSDLGSYQSLLALRESLNIPTYPANTRLLGSEKCLVVSDGPEVNIIGLNNIGVIVDKGQVLVLNLDESQAVKTIAENKKPL